jgi:hypothetical protein
MLNAAGGGILMESDGRNDGRRAIVSDLVSLIEHVQASLKLIESAIVRETPLGNEELGGNVVVLDDVTPCYIRVNAALNACNAGLGVALHLMLDTRMPKHGTGEPAERARQAVRLTGRG